MVSVKLLKEPGYVYDLNFIFYLKFNYKTYLESLPDDDLKDSRKKFFDSVQSEFGAISDDLYVFYHALENGKTFITESYVAPYSDLFATEFNFDFFLGKLQDTDTLIRKLIEFYLYDLTPGEIELCATSYAELVSRIKGSAYTSTEKSKLYEFFADPLPAIQCLHRQLVEKELVLSQYYEKNYQKIFDIFNKTTFETLSQQVKDFEDLTFMKNGKQTLSTSYCLLNKFCLFSFALENGIMYLLGYEYTFALDTIKDQSKEPSLSVFCSGLAEDVRMVLLMQLLKKGECTCKEFERDCNLSPSTVYHHIRLLLKSGIVKTRNKGKTIYYSIDRDYIDSVIKTLNKYSTRRE